MDSKTFLVELVKYVSPVLVVALTVANEYIKRKNVQSRRSNRRVKRG